MSIDIERLKIDPAYWDEVAPEGATHYSKKYCQYYKREGHSTMLWDLDGWVLLRGFTASDFDNLHANKRPAVSPASLISDERAAEIAETGIPVSELIPTVNGQKHDAHKPRHSLLPVGSVASVIDVLEFGAVKYGADNWQSVPDARTRYYDAAMRHLGAWWGGERLDAESGLPHLAHAACCILFLMWGDK